MRSIAQTARYNDGSVSEGLSTWNRRLLTVTAVAILWAASMLTLQAAGPNARAMIAGEGMLYTVAE